MVSEKLFSLGFLVLLIGIAIIAISLFINASSGKSTVKGGIVGFIGPIPFGFGTDKRILYVLIGIGVALFVLSLIFRRLIVP